MKQFKIVSAFILVLFFASTLLVGAQTKGKKKGIENPIKIEKARVPASVTDSYLREYPGTSNEFWYGHPGYTADEWYGYDPYFYENEYPAYYIVEFNKDSTPYKAVYTKEGVKIATHVGLHVELPNAITAALSKGVYKSWKIDNHKEEIFKSSGNDVLKVYRVVIGKGKGIHTLYYRADGTMLKDVKHKR